MEKKMSKNTPQDPSTLEPAATAGETERKRRGRAARSEVEEHEAAKLMNEMAPRLHTMIDTMVQKVVDAANSNILRPEVAALAKKLNGLDQASFELIKNMVNAQLQFVASIAPKDK
jgi:DNA-directed RNA polymerase sigma subunit (sigma70/sigma32)